MGKDSHNLDFLRACAVLTVYLGHVFQLVGITHVGPYEIDSFSNMGVLIFFVHTSLVLMLSMGRLGVTGESLVKAFYIRRAFRIYPLSVLVCVVAVVFAIPSFPTRPYVWVGWFHFTSNILLTQNLTYSPSLQGPSWSLPLEVQMYVVLPFLFMFLLRRPGWKWPALLWIAAVAVAPIQDHLLGRLSVLQYAPCFLGGALAYALLSLPHRQFASWGWPLTIATAYAIRSGDLRTGWLACLFVGAAIPHFREIGWRWLRAVSSWIARYSYGIYLTHVAVFWIAFVLLKAWHPAMQVAACAVLSVGVPVVLYHAVEKPMIDLGVRLARRVARPVGRVREADG